jgi:DNA-binding beta-propeller fold protein YncE
MHVTKIRIFVVLTAAVLLAAGLGPIALADPPAADHFQRTWERTDKPVADLSVLRTWMWGPEAFTGPLDEDYADAPGGVRLVQYFDKSRMEDNTWRMTDVPWDVTNGLLVVEMMSGQLQVADGEFHPRPPAQVNVGGDADDPTSPTYTTMALVRDTPPLPDDELITWTIDRDGAIGQAPPDIANLGVTAAYRLDQPNLDHQVASVFWQFMTSTGEVWEEGQLVTAGLFLNAFYATGYPVTEAYWANIKVAGTYQWVLLQCFERRCLTYTPGNAPGWQVEAGNVGQHYYTWRYGQPPGEPTPTATEPGAPTASATATSSPTPTATETQPQPPAPPAYEFSTTFGEAWDPTTLMSDPQGVAQDGSIIYVADTNNHRIQKYSYDGIFLLQWGSQGSGQGQFNKPTGVAVDPNGNVYVTDRDNARVQIFDSNGNWLQTVTTIDPGGPILHAFQSPEDIAIGGGFAWVADSGRQQLLGFPTYLNSGKGVLSAVNLSTPTGVAFDSGANLIWVTDTGPGFTDVKRYDLQGGLQATTTVPGTTFLSDVTTDSAGSLWVMDSATSQLHKWYPVGGWNPEFGGTGTDPGQFNSPGALAAGFGGELIVADTGNHRIQRMSTIGVAVDLWSDNRRGRYLLPSGIEWVDGGINEGIYVVDTGLSRIQVIDYQGAFLDDWGAGTTVASGDPALLFPLDIAKDSFGNLFVADTVDNRIVQYQGRGQFVQQWGSTGSGPGQFNLPLSVATDAAGNVYVADGGNHRIQKFNPAGQFIKEWGGHGNLLGAFDTPSGLAVSGNLIYVVDQGNNRIQQFDLDGNYTDITWGDPGSSPGQFNVPADIAIGPDGNIYVADSQNHRIQAFTPDGQFLRAWGSGPGNGPTQFDAPIDIAFLAGGETMYVTDRNNHRIQVLAIPI